MGFGKIGSALTAATLSFVSPAGAEEVTSTHSSNHVSVGVEAMAGQGVGQIKLARDAVGPLQLGVLGSFGVNSEKRLILGAEIFAAISKHITHHVGLALELSGGVESERSREGESHVEPIIKATGLVEGSVSEHVGVFAGPWVAKAGKHAHIGGTAGVTWNF